MMTEEQKRAVGARGSVVVSASAGSGKTFVMIERYVAHILSGGDVRRTLAVTFTKKAAAQIRERLRLALLKAVSEGDAQTRARLKDQLLALPLADVCTIHAFCGRLVRANFFLAGTDAAFRIVSPDGAEGRALSLRAMDEAFETAYREGGESFRDLLSVYFRRKKDARLRAMTLSLHAAVREIADYRTVLLRAGEGGFGEVCGYLTDLFRERIARIGEGTKERAAFFHGKNARADKACGEILTLCRLLLGADSLFAMAELAADARVGVMPPMTKAEGEELFHLRRLSSSAKELRAVLAELRSVAPRETEERRFLDARRRAAALASLVLSYDEIYARMKAEAGVLDYNDLQHLALRVLSDEDARASLRARYDEVFVDEYQDVNPVQERILSAVAGSERFFVGDGKQAIYGFRGSRSEYFDARARESDHALQLSENFRSAPAVLDVVNRVFAPLVEHYTPMRGGSRYGEHRGEVRFHAVPRITKERGGRGVYSVLGAARADRTDALSEAVADLVERECASGEWYDADAGAVKRTGFGDVAVLVRKNSGDAERIVRALADRDIPVTATSRVNVCDFFEASLLLDWLSYLDNAEQDIPYASALLSAIGGFTDADLAKIRLRFPSPYTFRDACRSYSEKMADGLAAKLRAFDSLAVRLRALSNIRSAAEMTELLLSMGLEAQIAAKPDGELRLARVRKLVAEAADAGSVHDFLARLKAADYRVDYTEGAGENAVKVLTMHASKGLEFPVVILASLDAPFHGAERDETMWTERFLISPKSFDRERGIVSETLARRAAAAYQEAEERLGERNLLYVAMTRARYRLHLMVSDAEPSYLSDRAGRMSELIDLSAFSDLFEGETAARPPVAAHALAARADAETKERILAAYRRPYPYEASTTIPVKSSATELMREERRHSFAGGGSGFDTETGLAYHAFLEHVRFGEGAEEELARMRREGILGEDRLALLDVCKLREILAIPCLAALAGRSVRRECTFLLRLPANEMFGTEATDDVVFQGAIDLLVEDENGYTVIDYKYTSHDDARVREDYAVQIALYKKAVARAMRVDERTVRARIVNIAACREIAM